MQSTLSGILRHVYRIYVYYICMCISVSLYFCWEIMITISFTQSSIPSSTRQPCIGGNGTRSRSICIYMPTCTNSTSYISLKLYMIRADIYIYIDLEMQTNNFRGVNLVWNIWGELERLGYVLFTCPSRTHMFLFRGTGICGFSLWRLMLKALLVFFRWVAIPGV